MKPKHFDKTYIFLLLMFLMIGAVSWNLYFKVYRQEDTVSIHEFPKEIEGWTSTELPVTDDERAILETDNVFVRRYTNSIGKEVYLFIVYSQNNRKVSHPPEVCYLGSGAAVTSSVHDSIVSARDALEIKTNKLTVEKGKFRQILFYWFKVGDSFTSNYWKQQGLIALKSFLGQPASSALIRISATVKASDTVEATDQIKEFGRLIIPHLSTYLP